MKVWDWTHRLVLVAQEDVQSLGQASCNEGKQQGVSEAVSSGPARMSQVPARCETHHTFIAKVMSCNGQIKGEPVLCSCMCSGKGYGIIRHTAVISSSKPNVSLTIFALDYITCRCSQLFQLD